MRAVSPPQLEGPTAELVEEFAGIFAREAITDCVVDSYERLRPARIPDFLSLLAYRFARERLLAAARARGHREASVPSVLFVCTHNSRRSQLAAALQTHRAGDRVEVSSAGSHPVGGIASEVVPSLSEVGIDPPGLFPKPITDDVIRGSDVTAHVTRSRRSQCHVS